jgi:hypothetical protein
MNQTLLQNKQDLIAACAVTEQPHLASVTSSRFSL